MPPLPLNRAGSEVRCPLDAFGVSFLTTPSLPPAVLEMEWSGTGQRTSQLQERERGHQAISLKKKKKKKKKKNSNNDKKVKERRTVGKEKR